jgi:hypothetical protein
MPLGKIGDILLYGSLVGGIAGGVVLVANKSGDHQIQDHQIQDCPGWPVPCGPAKAPPLATRVTSLSSMDLSRPVLALRPPAHSSPRGTSLLRISQPTEW